MKKIMLVIILITMFSLNLFSQEKMAIVSFTGSKLSEGEARSLLNIFSSELNKSQYRKDFSMLSRNDSDLRVAYSELNYQRTAMLNASQMSKVGEQLGADWVFYGTVDEFNGANVTINILEVETSRIIATVTQTMPSIFEVNTRASEMVRELAAKLRNENFVSRKSGDEALLQHYTTMKWVGRGMWIGGTTAVVAGYILMMVSMSYEETNYSDPYANPANYVNPLVAGGITCLVTGGVLLAAGITLDVIYGKKEKEAKENLQYAFTPYVLPDMNGNYNAGAQFVFSYKF